MGESQGGRTQAAKDAYTDTGKWITTELVLAMLAAADEWDRNHGWIRQMLDRLDAAAPERDCSPWSMGVRHARSIVVRGAWLGVVDGSLGVSDEPPDWALGRCQAVIQCHRETGHEGGHEAREEAL
jgi:hypothetical protein